ncbi:uncharacterized protein PHALS_04317 [Plasmopara halstedii]|uniref:Uncharacterized protein n=1 Tax=Plasmopara halstedii TaxID=4781 RepID=A0A0P1AZX4_PLAHL|nr:uncharacterized protein PHALS_04317 [Plasmopara halstedii]CEG47442.1 hypothetical protein PHALS_04317 [Plasmopara halstedii]|eukprot:XP_024583811.1 hypothetical protein PHALS_04317 [Plasmopara halstedii]
MSCTDLGVVGRVPPGNTLNYRPLDLVLTERTSSTMIGFHSNVILGVIPEWYSKPATPNAINRVSLVQAHF